MSNFEDDEALFDDIYADGDQQTTVDTAPTTTAEHQEPKQDATSAHPVYSGNSLSTGNMESSHANENSESNGLTTLSTSDAVTANDALQVKTGSNDVNATGAASFSNPLQQLQQMQMMQQQQQQQQPQQQSPDQVNANMAGMQGMQGFPAMQSFPGMQNMQGMQAFAGMQGMPGMPSMPGMQGMMPQMSQYQQFQQAQQQQHQNQPQQQQNFSGTATASGSPDQYNQNVEQEHIPDITEIEAPTNITDTVKADLKNKDVGKLFIGGLNWETNEDRLKQYFSKYGEVTEMNVMRDNNTGKSRGFAFLTFASGDSVDAVMKEKHILDGKLIDPKRAIPKDEQEKVGKVFVGGIAAEVTPEEFRNFFEKFGSIIDSQLMINKDTGKSRGYGFVTYDSAEAVERATKHHYVMFHGKKMEIKKAEPRTQHLKNQGRVLDSSVPNMPAGSALGGYGGMGNPMAAGMMGANGGYGDMSQYWQQMQQMQQYWMQMQQMQQMQQQQQQQNGSPSSQDAQLNMYSSGYGGNNGGDDDDVPNPQERDGDNNDRYRGRDDGDDDQDDGQDYGDGERRRRRGGRGRGGRGSGRGGNYDDNDDRGSDDRRYGGDRDEDRDDPRLNLPSGPKKLREREDGGSSGPRFNERRSGGSGGRRNQRHRGGRRGGSEGYHPYRR